MTYRIIPAIMSGGAGTRLWPLSTEERPKQFHRLGGDETLFAATARRVSGEHGALSYAAPIVLCNARYEALVRENVADVSAIVLEPAPRNTAAVAAIAAVLGAEIEPNALVLLLPSDQIVRDIAAFHTAVESAAAFANERIVTFGITPNRPATGYGYIKRGAEFGDGVFALDTFKEKPDQAAATGYLASGAYSWNAGIFLFKPSVLLAEFDASADIRDAALAALSSAKRNRDVIALDADLFSKVRPQPLDIAVMEKTARAAVVPCSMGWADIGSWDEVWRLTPRGESGFAILGPAAAPDIGKMTASGVKAVAIEGDDLVVVAGPHGLLIVPQHTASDAVALKQISDSMA